MKIVVFSLTISSTWGNGHATLWRGLSRALARRGHDVSFFVRDTPCYATNRDLSFLPGGKLIRYSDWDCVRRRAAAEVAGADVAMVTSYCPDGIAASDLVRGEARGTRVFYDLDTSVTLSRLEAGKDRGYTGQGGLSGFDLVLSYTGGAALDRLRRELGARRVAPLYGRVDPQVHRPVAACERYRADLSYLGTYAADRQAALEALLVLPARRRPDRRFLIGGAQYPQEFPSAGNIYFVRHLPPTEHAAFFSSCRLTLNVTRRPMAAMGWCPSGRLFEAAACGAPILTDGWDGLDAFIAPCREILVAADANDAEAALDLTDAELRRIADAGRTCILEEHTSDRRAEKLEALLSNVFESQPMEA